MSYGKIIVKGKLTLTSPLRIGSGKDENTDCDVLTDSNNLPYIPATSFAGILKRETSFVSEKKLKEYEIFWGANSENQSRISIDDLVLSKGGEIAIRDGIRINSSNGMVADMAKFDAEIVERGAEFSFELEVDVQENDQQFFREMTGLLINLLKEGIKLGAKTHSGFGRVKLKEYAAREFDFANKKDVIAWLRKDFELSSDLKIETPYKKENSDFTIDAFFTIKNSLIVRSYSSDPESPDAIHIKSKGKNVLPGSSSRGALRARAEKILRTMHTDPDAEIMLSSLFGGVEKDELGKEKPDGYKLVSRLGVEEIEIDETIEELQRRIKIDRFTGGTIESALFDNMPLFPLNGKVHIKNFRITIEKPTDSDKGLALLLLKDLWTGDLAIGGEKNVGRGVLNGIQATISCLNKGEPFSSSFKDITNLSKEDNELLDEWITTLIENGDRKFHQKRINQHLVKEEVKS